MTTSATNASTARRRVRPPARIAAAPPPGGAGARVRSTHGEKAKPRRALRADRGSSCSARGEKSRAAEMRRVNPELTRESPRFISARRPPIGRFRSSPIRLIFLSPLVFLPASILVRAPARRAQFHSRAGPDSAARGVRSPGSDRRDRLASHTNIRWVAVPCWPVFRRDCPNFFVTIASACRPGAKGICGGSGIASSSPGPSAPPSDAEATTSPSESSRSRLQRLAHRPCRRARGDGRPHVLPSRVRLTPGRFVLPTTTTAPLARASPRPDATRSRQPRAARLSFPEPSFARLTAFPFPPAGTRSRFLRTGREEDKRADDALTGRRLHRGSRVFLVIRCSTTPARAVALPAVTRASSLPA